MPFPSATTKAAPEPAIDGSPRGVLAVQFGARHEMALEPELLQLALVAGLWLRQLGRRQLGLRQLGRRQLGLRQLGGQAASLGASWGATAGAASTLRHELVWLVLLRHLRRRALSLQPEVAERAGLLPRSEGGWVPPFPGSTGVVDVGPLRGRLPVVGKAAEGLEGLEGRLDRRALGAIGVILMLNGPVDGLHWR